MGQGKLTTTLPSDNWPQFLENAQKATRDEKSWQPRIIEMKGKVSEEKLQDLLEREHITSIVDNYDEQYAELIVSRQPGLYQTAYDKKVSVLEEELARHHATSHAWQKGSWVYYPWSRVLVHIIQRDLFLELRSTRNRNLVTAEEQSRLEKFNVGCAGMSVGSNVAISIGIGGMSQQIKIADGAVISGSNLNRVLAGVGDVGLSKSIIVARKLYEMNPYLSIERFGTNITSENIVDFFEKPWPVHAIVDEVDDLKVKLLLRVEARKRRLPVIMATDLGDDVMLDVERFDLDPNLPFFHGLVDDIEELLTKDFHNKAWLRWAMAIVDPGNASLRAQESLMQIGHELAAQPQLGSTAIMAGGVVAYAVRKIALGEELKSGRTMISLDSHLLPKVNTADYRLMHEQSTAMIKQTFGL
jgi:hypothetical protein